MSFSENQDVEYETKQCPFCCGSMHELADLCPHCGMWYQVKPKRRSTRWILLVVIVVVLILAWFLGLWRFV